MGQKKETAKREVDHKKERQLGQTVFS